MHVYYTTNSHHSSDSIFDHLRPPSLNSNYTQPSPIPHSPSHIHSSSETDDSESNNNDGNSRVQVNESNVLETIEIVDEKGHVKLTRMGMNASDVFKLIAAKSEIVKRKNEGTCGNTVELESSVWYDLMGDDKLGRARGYGIGVTKSSLTAFRAKLRQMQSESENSNAHDNEIVQLKLLLSKQQQQLVAQENVMNAYMAKTNRIIGNLRDEVLLYRTAFGAGTEDLLRSYHLKTSSGTKSTVINRMALGSLGLHDFGHNQMEMSSEKSVQGCTQALETGEQFQAGCSADAFINELT